MNYIPKLGDILFYTPANTVYDDPLIDWGLFKHAPKFGDACEVIDMSQNRPGYLLILKFNTGGCIPMQYFMDMQDIPNIFFPFVQES